jgi:tRNA 2-thiouridine synthesizing protein A
MQELDLSGLKCPLPVLRTKKALGAMPPGASLRIITTDPLAGIDIPHLCVSEGHRLLLQETAGGGIAFVIAKAG